MAEQELEMEVEDYSLKKEKKNKKRKRKQPIDLKIEMVKENQEKIAPLVGYFPTGYDPHKKAQDDEMCDDVKVYRHVRRSRLELVVKPKGSKVNFVGTNYSGEAEAPISCQYALGVFDKETQTLKIVKIESNKIFRLEPKFAGKDKAPEEAKVEALTAQERAERLNDLTMALGTKKAKKQVREKANLNRKEDEETQKQMGEKIKKLKVLANGTAGDDSEPARNIPYHDTTAETPERAYPIEKIISKGENEILQKALHYLFYTEKVALEAFPIFVRNRIQKMKEIEDETERRTLGIILSYMTHLIKFKDKHSVDHQASAKDHQIPEMLLQSFKSKFKDADGGGKKKRELSGPKNDLLISHVLVLSLMVDDFNSNPTDIAADLRMTTLKLRPHYLNLGVKMVGGKGKGKVAQATLPVPLNFPPMEQRRRKKGRKY
ncbi:hypothetical protein MKW92_045344 [Papaver armeniacum]|nr:hypothetical protein MKW92_045344 [Papaver armeniacum]